MSGTATYHVGDSLAVLAELPAESVDLVVTSPPFLNLRSYLPDDHPDKAREVGAEPGPGAFVDALIEHTEAWARVLAPHGSIVVELGDTYSGTGGAGGDWSDSERTTLARRKGGGAGGPIRRTIHEGWPDAKSLCLVPELYRLALAYGVNPLTGRTTPRWLVRNVVRWCRPNPPVGALADKFRPATSDIAIATRSRSRYFDLDAVRKPTNTTTPGGIRRGTLRGTDERREADGAAKQMTPAHPLGAPPLDYWEVPTAAYRGEHFASYPAELVRLPVETMCPPKVCQVCGEPSRRIVERERATTGNPAAPSNSVGNRMTGAYGTSGATTYTTVGWSDCGHDAWRPGVVLDPFAGTGTTLAVATGHGRDAIGIDLDERNAHLARSRLGMFVEVV